jgi:succinate dehydrogenase/fumarate reductase-like Fe-S protein
MYLIHIAMTIQNENAVKSCRRMICPACTVFVKEQKGLSRKTVFENVFVVKFLSYEVFATQGNALD